MHAPWRTRVIIRARGTASALALFNARLASLEVEAVQSPPTAEHTDRATPTPAPELEPVAA